MLRDKPEDAGVLEFCDALAAQLNQGTAFGEPVRALVDRKSGRAIDKRWAWIKRGVPVICDIGHAMWRRATSPICGATSCATASKIASQVLPREQFVAQIGALLASIHAPCTSQRSNAWLTISAPTSRPSRRWRRISDPRPARVR